MERQYNLEIKTIHHLKIEPGLYDWLFDPEGKKSDQYSLHNGLITDTSTGKSSGFLAAQRPEQDGSICGVNFEALTPMRADTLFGYLFYQDAFHAAYHQKKSSMQFENTDINEIDRKIFNQKELITTHALALSEVDALSMNYKPLEQELNKDSDRRLAPPIYQKLKAIEEQQGALEPQQFFALAGNIDDKGIPTHQCTSNNAGAGWIIYMKQPHLIGPLGFSKTLSGTIDNLYSLEQEFITKQLEKNDDLTAINNVYNPFHHNFINQEDANRFDLIRNPVSLN